MNKYKVYRYGEKEPIIAIGLYPLMERGKLVLFEEFIGFDKNKNPVRKTNICAAFPDVEWFYMVENNGND